MNKVWLITGCSKGFGLAFVEELLKTPDANVVATARKTETLMEKFKDFKDRVLILQLDVTNQSEIDNAVKKTIDHFGRIDVLVNNAGYGLLGAFEECSMEDIKTQFETNVFGLMAMTKAVLPHMRSQGSGHIFNLSSIAGLVSRPGGSIYSSTKFAVEGLSEGAAEELESFGIHMTIIEPGPFRTGFAGESLHVAPALDAYNNNKAHHFRDSIKQVHGHQVGDPHKAARIIIQIAEMKEPPLRMILGNPALERLAVKMEQFNKEVKQNEPITRSADFDKP
jgi:hypothetical protein